jgi:mono/diheme cytochrome c family protein
MWCDAMSGSGGPTALFLLVATLSLGGCAGQSALGPIDTPARTSFDAASIARGAQLAAVGNCKVCHTASSGRPYAGGRPFKTPFGTVYSTNITPEPETGIGRWSEAAFVRAMREGLGREGRNLYPAFPYDHFTKLTDEDLKAIYGFIMTREAVHDEGRANELRFPFGFRSLLSVWKLLFFERGAFQPDASKTSEWNRGAYLVEGLGHCGACHTPRNLLGAEKKGQHLAGGDAEGWHSPALNAASPSPVPWTAAQLQDYLDTGLIDRHAITAGPMAPVVHNLATVPEQDVRAIAAYLATIAGPPGADRQKKSEDALARAERDIAAYPSVLGPSHGEPAQNNRSGELIYAGTCAACHNRGRETTSEGALHLSLGTVMTIPTSANLIRIIRSGINPEQGEAGRFMPAYANELTDGQTRDLVTYIRAHFGQAPAWPDVEAEIKKAREELREANVKRSGGS